jgi:hypothetical protein
VSMVARVLRLGESGWALTITSKDMTWVYGVAGAPVLIVLNEKGVMRQCSMNDAMNLNDPMRRMSALNSVYETYGNLSGIGRDGPVHDVRLRAQRAITCVGACRPYDEYSFVTGRRSGDVVFHDENGLEKKVLSIHSGQVYAVSVSNVSGRLASSAWDQTVKITSPVMTVICERFRMGCTARNLTWSPDGRALSVLWDDGIVEVM